MNYYLTRMSRDSLDTDILRIRNVTAINPKNQDYIQPQHIPNIGRQGVLQWYSSLQFLSTILIPSTGCTALDILTTVQGGISTMSTIQSLALTNSFVSTVLGLQESGYVDTSYILNRINNLSGDYGYISTTSLYDIINNLSITLLKLCSIAKSNADLLFIEFLIS